MQQLYEMILCVQQGKADFAMVPVENSTAGRVADIHHILPESGLYIIGEHYQPVEHKLLAIKGANWQILPKYTAMNGAGTMRNRWKSWG